MKLSCDFCEHRCLIQENSYGRCGIRKNSGGHIETVNYGDTVSVAIDPIEKKPLYHFFPGAQTLSVALAGCNFSCAFCQNYAISQKEYFKQLQTKRYEPEELVSILEKKKLNILTFTYSEPTVWQDYMINTAMNAKKLPDVYTAMVTNGFFTEEALQRISPLIDAFNIDLKGDDQFYKKYCGTSFDPVLRNISQIAAMKQKIIEVTTLVMEGIHTIDSIINIGRELENAGVQVWHLSRFFPCYKMSDHTPTSESFMEKLLDTILQKLSIPHIYIGNSSNPKYNNTYCPSCNKQILSREHMSLENNSVINNRCNYCNSLLYGRFKP